jgi:caffeoyl-CoA O-methyltransferase
MFIAMNRFQVKASSANDFEKIWRERDSHLSKVEGFVRFQLLRGSLRKHDEQDRVEFVSHSTWLTEQNFLAWTESEEFRRAHAPSEGRSATREMLLGPPEFRSYSVVLDQVPSERSDFRSVHQDLVVEKHFVSESEAQQELRRWALDVGLPPIRVGAFEGRLIECLLRANGARKGVEIGTLGGYSASWILGAMPRDAQLYTLELEVERAQAAQAKLNSLGFEGRVQVIAGDARQQLQEHESLKDIKDLDFVFIDADKASYGDYVTWAIPRLRKGGLLLADNAYIWGAMNHYGKVASDLPLPASKGRHSYSKTQFEGMSRAWQQMAEHPELASIILPTGEGLGLAVKI